MKKIVCTVFSFLLIICLCGPVVAIGNIENKASKEENDDRYFDYTACENTVRCVTVSY